jgi:hypothetical protein
MITITILLTYMLTQQSKCQLNSKHEEREKQNNHVHRNKRQTRQLASFRQQHCNDRIHTMHYVSLWGLEWNIFQAVSFP